MTSTFDDGASDWAPEYDATTALDDDVVMRPDDVEAEDSLSSVDEQEDDGSPAEEPRFGTTLTYDNLTNPETGNTVQWEVNDGWTDRGTGEPVDYWKTEST